MVRRWCILLAMLALTVGTAVTASSASAATSAGAVNPGGLIHLAGGSSSATTGTYSSVSASWTQPSGKCSSGDQYAAFWVGLDGYSSSTVEQTGSEVDCVGRTAEYYAWYEMYPGPSENYPNTVRAGDHFNASVTYEGSNKFSLYIADTTQGWSHTTVASLSGAARSSAEVIVEAPCCTGSGGILPLTDFGTINLTNSLANGAALGSAGGVTGITMVDNSGRDKDTISSLSGGENFSATWVRSN
ncbi:MAG: G1 family glutamic endopeptidase [Streptosporangiaceae bacterium]